MKTLNYILGIEVIILCFLYLNVAGKLKSVEEYCSKLDDSITVIEQTYNDSLHKCAKVLNQRDSLLKVVLPEVYFQGYYKGYYERILKAEIYAMIFDSTEIDTIKTE